MLRRRMFSASTAPYAHSPPPVLPRLVSGWQAGKVHSETWHYFLALVLCLSLPSARTGWTQGGIAAERALLRRRSSGVGSGRAAAESRQTTTFAEGILARCAAFISSL